MSTKHDTTQSLRLTRRLRAAVLPPLLLGLLAVPGRAQAPSVEARLQALETELRELRAENAELRRDLGGPGKSGANLIHPNGPETTLTIGGLVQAQGDFGDRGDSRGSANDRIRLRRVRLGVSGQFARPFDFKIEGEYVGSSVTLTDGYVDWNRLPWANVRVGQFKTPYGFEFLAADPKLFTIERSFGTDRLTLNRQVGAQVAGDWLGRRLTYAVGLFNGNGANVTTNDNEQFTYVGRLAAVPWRGGLAGWPAQLGIGVDGFTSTDTALTLPSDFGFLGNSFTGHRHGSGVDGQLKVGPVEVWAEYLRVQFEPLNAVPAHALVADSWYLQATCFVVPKSIQAVVKFETFDPNGHKAGGETDSWILGANWFLNGDALKLQAACVYTTVPAPLGIQRQLMLRAQTLF